MIQYEERGVSILFHTVLISAKPDHPSRECERGCSVDAALGTVVAVIQEKEHKKRGVSILCYAVSIPIKPNRFLRERRRGRTLDVAFGAVIVMIQSEEHEKGHVRPFTSCLCLCGALSQLYSHDSRGPVAIIWGEKHEERGMFVLFTLSVSMELRHSPMVTTAASGRRNQGREA